MFFYIILGHYSLFSLITSRGVAIFAKAFMGIPAQQAAKTTRPLMPAAAPAVLLLSLDTQQGVSNIILAMTRRDFGKPAFSLRKKRFVKTHALSLLGTTRLLSRSECVVQYKIYGNFFGFHHKPYLNPAHRLTGEKQLSNMPRYLFR
ncbi:MAG: hypothetical protein Q8R54_05480 [Methylobacter sp.]|nr:hypothetical protein [Methylobacter sp.]